MNPEVNSAALAVFAESQPEPATLATLTAPEQHPAAVYLASLGERSRRTMSGDLNIIASILTNGRDNLVTLDWASLRYSHCAALRSVLAERYSFSSANRMLSALRGVLKACWRLGQLPTEEYHRAIDLQPVRGETLPRGRALSGGELRELFSVCDTATHGGLRDRAMLGILYGCGLRRSELVALNLGDYTPETGELRVLSGKGNKQRAVYLPDGAKIALDRWLFVRGEVVGTDEAAPLFLPIDKGGKSSSDKIKLGRLVDQSVMYILTKRAAQAGLKKTSPHDFRRTFVSDLLDAGADITTVQKMAGHANVTTTARYDRRGEVAKQKAASLLHVPS